MNDLLQEAIVGSPVTVTIGRETYPLAFPIQGVILYKRETARLGRERTPDRPRLTREEKRALREARQELLADANLPRSQRGEGWDPEKFRDFELGHGRSDGAENRNRQRYRRRRQSVRHL
jgi:hypothetical protein